MSTTEAPPAPANAAGEPTPTGAALAVVTPKEMVTQYSDSFAAVLPSHIARPETWIRVAQGALKKGKLHAGGPQTELEVAALNNPGVFLATLLDAARLGLEPGTEQYYLTPREVKGRLEILGIVGYQGIIELMYRAGAVESVVAECVYSKDLFSFRPGVDHIPTHEIDWDADDRGQLRLVYAFARMRGGAISKVIVMNKAAIAKIMRKSHGSGSKYSPWQTDPDSMWLKSAVRQLRKWVPTSSEYITHRLRAERDAGEQRPILAPVLDGPDLPVVDAFEDDDEIVDVEIVDEDAAAAPSAEVPETPGTATGEGEEEAGEDAPEPATSEPATDLFNRPDSEPAAEPEAAATSGNGPSDEEPKGEEAGRDGAVGVADVARLAGQVFKAAYDDAPNGKKTKVAEQLRHAVVFAETGGAKASLKACDGTELVKITQRLRSIAAGELAWKADEAGVTFTMAATGRHTRVLFAQLEQIEAA